ncbi:MAG: hypothetical protein EHM91_16300 [Planctomycetota bacterium]|nr:MAG: hypothetical protein EHM91_16300 [Planctomycetota bacterium]
MKAASSHRKVKGKARPAARAARPKARLTRDKKKTQASARPSRTARPSKTARSSKYARPAKTEVTRARATAPARATHASSPLVAPVRRTPIPSPLPTRHVAQVRTAVTMPARSMPPAVKDQRRPAPIAVAAPKPPVVIPEFGEAGVLLAITYSIREGRRGEFFDLMRELKPLLHGIGGGDVAIYEDRSRPNYLMEVFRFKDEVEFTAFDDKFHKDRKIAAIYALLDDIVEAEKSDFKIFERRL